MRLLVDNFVSTIVFVIIVFSVVSFATVEMQVMSARQVHTSAVSQVQSSYYMVTETDLNESLNDSHKALGWEFELRDTPDGGRFDKEVILNYRVVLPVFNVSREAQIEGYAR